MLMLRTGIQGFYITQSSIRTRLTKGYQLSKPRKLEDSMYDLKETMALPMHKCVAIDNLQQKVASHRGASKYYISEI
jgi:hypothetical protein